MAKTISENAPDMNAGNTSGAKRIDGDDVKMSGIRKDMNVIASCGKSVGVVDGVDINSIKLKCDDCGDNQSQLIPLNWISHVDSQVHLNKNSREAAASWN